MVYADDDRSTPIVGIIMGSQSDWPTMKNAALILDELGIPYEKRIISAHRTPKRMTDYAENARERGLKIIVAGAGGAALLAASILSINDTIIAKSLKEWRDAQTEAVDDVPSENI